MTRDNLTAMVGHSLHYKDIFLFVDAVGEHAAIPAKRAILQRDLSQLLRGTAAQWYIGSLTENDRTWLKGDLDRYFVTLKRQFGMSRTEAALKMQQCLYSDEDCR